jgi:hypothetical protein
MRLLILAAAATLAITGTAMADESAPTHLSAAHHHHRHSGTTAAAAVTEGAAPVDTLNAHDARMKNLHDSGYNPAGDFTPAGTIKQN